LQLLIYFYLPMSVAEQIVSRYNRVFKREREILERTRVGILAVCLLTFIGLTGALFILYIFQEQNFALIRMGILLALFLTGFALLLFRKPWSLAGHFFIICITLMIWSALLLFKHSLNVSTAEVVVLVLSGGYYILGSKWGTIYSLANIAVIIGYVIIDNYTDITVPTQRHSVNQHATMIGMVTNFLLLLYIHYAFFRAFKKSQLKEIELREHLQKALAAEREQADAKTNFLSTMSHELRTPLNAVIGMTHILNVEGPRPDQIEHLEVLRFAADNLMVTVNDILDFNKIDSGAVVLDSRPFHLAELLTNVCGSFKVRAAEKEINFSCKIDKEINGLTVMGDPDRLTSILFNLIGNAVKFTNAGHVRVEARLISKTETTASLRLRVEDTGIGIPPERQERIFQPFIQVMSRTNRQFHGTGLGLAIAYRLLQLHNSQLELNSAEGIGTTFGFELAYPLATTAVDESATKAPPAKEKAADPVLHLRILLAEDEPINVLVMTKILSKWGVVPAVAPNGREAVDMVTKQDFDVVLMDINMPVMDGLEASRMIKTLPDRKKAAIPIIAVTASIGTAVEQINDYPYIDDCLLKPFRPGDLLEKLQKLERGED
jgi:signal transduction histidine kinase/ActR/RegA family two-component response regulator